jgi:hypothetical protein
MTQIRGAAVWLARIKTAPENRPNRVIFQCRERPAKSRCTVAQFGRDAGSEDFAEVVLSLSSAR